MTVEQKKAQLAGWHVWAERAALAGYLAMAFLIPVFVIPLEWSRWITTFEKQITVQKEIATVAVGAWTLAALALCLFGPNWRRYMTAAWAGCAALGLFILWGSICLFAGPSPGAGIRVWLPHIMLGAAALGAPMVLHHPRRLQMMVAALAIGSVVVGGIAVISSAGWGAFNIAVYGVDPLKAADDAEAVQRLGGIQGGRRSGAAISTLGNPNFVGTYSAALACIAAIILLDWGTAANSQAKRWVLRGAGLFAVMVCLAALVVSSSRQAWLTLAIAAAFRLALFLDLPRLPLALWVCLMLGLLMGTAALGVTGFLLFAATGVGGVVAALVYLVKRGGLSERIRSAGSFNLSLSLGLPALGILVLIAFSTPGPWNPLGLRLVQRFTTITDGSDDSFRERAVMFMLASEMTWQNPIMGVGPGRYANQYSPMFADLSADDSSGVISLERIRIGRSIGLQTHNDYLQIAAETGLPGIVFFLAAILAMLAAMNQNIRHAKGMEKAVTLSVMIGLIAFLSTMFSAFPLQMPGRRAAFYALMACALGIAARTPAEIEADQPE